MRAPGYRNELDRPDYRSRKERHRTETVHMRSDGSEFPVEVFWREVNYDGCRARIAASFDISARRKAEAAARESLERYRTLFENCPVGIYRTTADGRILMANPALLRTLGYSPFEEIANLNLETDSIAHSRRVNGFVAKILAHGELPRFETEWKHRDGSLVPVREHAVALHMTGGLVFEGVVEDLTAQRAAEEQLRLSEGIPVRSLKTRPT